MILVLSLISDLGEIFGRMFVTGLSVEELFITKRLHVYVYCINTDTVCLDNKYQTINVSPTARWTEWQDMEQEEHLNYSPHAVITSLVCFKNSQKRSPVTLYYF